MRNFIELFLTSFDKCNLLSVNIFSLGLDMLLTNPVLAKKKETIILHTKIVEKFGKSWVLLIHLSQLSHIIS